MSKQAGTISDGGGLVGGGSGGNMPSLRLPSNTGGGAIRELQKHLTTLQGLPISESEPISLVVHDVLLLTEELTKIAADVKTFKVILAEGTAAINDADQLIQRYVSVCDPVVASDGFTYERESIEEYLQGCSRANTTPVSQQDGSPLSSTLLSNKTLQHLIKQLSKLACEYRDDHPPPRHSSSSSCGGAVSSSSKIDDETSLRSAVAISDSPQQQRKQSSSSFHKHDDLLLYGSPNLLSSGGPVKFTNNNTSQQQQQGYGNRTSVWGNRNTSRILAGHSTSSTTGTTTTSSSSTAKMTTKTASTTSNHVKPLSKVTAKSSRMDGQQQQQQTSSQQQQSESNGSNNNNNNHHHQHHHPPAIQRATAKRNMGRDHQTGSLTKPKLHPCVRVYGLCHYQDRCNFALYPYDVCLNHLKKKCRFGKACGEPHMDYQGPNGPQT